MSLAVITFISIFLLVGSAILLISYRANISARLSRLAGTGTQGEATIDDESPHERTEKLAQLFDPVQRLVPKSPQEVSVARRRLQLAGFHRDSHLGLLYAAKVIVPVTHWSSHSPSRATT